ncbi:hypothetical protein, partial [Hoeflea sp.]|uniref:hypothetical protein n=1 Tax=Hoeflea sp. TaxID=1940281 RepID=UPI0025B8C660
LSWKPKPLCVGTRSSPVRIETPGKSFQSARHHPGHIWPMKDRRPNLAPSDSNATQSVELTENEFAWIEVLRLTNLDAVRLTLALVQAVRVAFRARERRR